MKPLVITTCPTCGSKRIRAVKRDMTITRRGQAYDVKGIPVEDCPACGERLFGMRSFAAIDEQIEANGKRKLKSA